MIIRRDLTNKIYGRLTVLEFNGRRGPHNLWLCQCKCGNTKIILACNLITGKTKSCGCLEVEIRGQFGDRLKTHGLRKHPLYVIWAHIKERCQKAYCKAYKYYGERGIALCPEWEDFKIFYDWAIQNGWQRGLTIERIKNNNGYSPSNCTIATKLQQANNKTNNIFLNINGIEKTASEWSRTCGINGHIIRNRIKKGWPPELAVFLNKKRRQT